MGQQDSAQTVRPGVDVGHEMNGAWYSWGYGHTSPVTFVATWRHIVDIFREHGARNVTWMWTVNIIKTKNGRIPNPAPWWPGKWLFTWAFVMCGAGSGHSTIDGSIRGLPGGTSG